MGSIPILGTIVKPNLFKMETIYLIPVVWILFVILLFVGAYVHYKCSIPKVLKSEKEYFKLLRRFEKIFQSKPGTSKSKKAERMAKVLRAYEEKHFPIN